jgi:Phage integrase family
MTNLRFALERYLSMRQGLGYKYQHQARRLTDFVSFMETQKAATITTKLAVAWATLPPDRHASWALRLTDVRGFARHVANIDPQTEAPPAGILPRLKRAKPYVYSDAEVDGLLAAALALPPADGLRRWTYHCLFGLIVVTGMRLSEAIGLQRDDVDLDNGILTVDRPSSASRASCPCIRRPVQLSAATPNGAMLISDCAAVHTSSSPSAAAECCTSTSTGSSGDCLGRLAYAAQVITPGRACTTFGIASRSGRSSAGIARGRMSSGSFRCFPPISATPACATPIGISRPVRS